MKSSDILLVYKLRWQIELLFKLYKSVIGINHSQSKKNACKVLCEFYAKLCIIVIFHGLVSCIKLKNKTEISFTKVFISFKLKTYQFFFVAKKTMNKIKCFLKELVKTWERFSLKDRYKKKKMSTLSRLQLIAINS